MSYTDHAAADAIISDMVERERKFLVAQLPSNLSHYANDRIRQGYLAIETHGDHGEVRLRRVGQQYLLTVKQGRGQARSELELPLSTKRGRKLWPLTRGRRIQKRRYQIPYDGVTIELDVYSGKNHGLCIAEVEFDSEQEAIQFDAPDWFGEEVTGRRKFANSRIAVFGWK